MFSKKRQNSEPNKNEETDKEISSKSASAGETTSGGASENPSEEVSVKEEAKAVPPGQKPAGETPSGGVSENPSEEVSEETLTVEISPEKGLEEVPSGQKPAGETTSGGVSENPSEEVSEEILTVEISLEKGLEEVPSGQKPAGETPPEEVPENECVPFVGMRKGITYWGFSQKGESHKNNGLPCQDCCQVLVSGDDTPIIIAVIADGVGSCALSHYGAETAVKSSAEFLKKKLDACPDKKFEDREIGNLLREAMQCAYDSVQKMAEKMDQLEYSFQSTLTIAIYNGTDLYISHAGDGGVVALTEERKLELVTSRIKGEEAGSVYPLQAGSGCWQVFKVSSHVNGFVMATDGVLDKFVQGEKVGNGVYYPFIQPAFEVKQKERRDVEETANFYYNYMAGEEYRKAVTDDLTLVVVTNRRELKSKKNFPVFDEKAFYMKIREYQAKIKRALYPVCPHCGGRIASDYKYCPNCGKQLLML